MYWLDAPDGMITQMEIQEGGTHMGSEISVSLCVCACVCVCVYLCKTDNETEN